MPGERKNPLHGVCSSLMAELPEGTHGDKPYLVAWLGERLNVPEQVWMELAEIMIEALVQDRNAAAQRPRIDVSERRQEMEQMRAESLLLRLESVLARAAGRAARHSAQFNRSAARLSREAAGRGRLGEAVAT